MAQASKNLQANAAKKAAKKGASAQGGTPTSTPSVPPNGSLAWERLWKHFAKVVLSGFVIGGAVAVFAWWTEAPGLIATANDLWGHVWEVHPMFYTSVAFVVCAAIAGQGLDINKLWLDRWFSGPLLNAMAHLLSFSTGALFPLAAVNHEAWRYRQCEGHGGLFVLFAALLAFALMAVGGLLVVDGRIEENDAISKGASHGPQPQAEKASKFQLAVFSLMAVGFFVVSVYCARWPGDTKQIVTQALHAFQETCTGPLVAQPHPG
jgi:hypothetical protein